MMLANKRSLYTLLACIASFGLGGSANANSYIGLDGSSVSISHSSKDEINPLGLRVRLGLRMGRGLDIEAHLGGGTDSTAGIFDEFSTVYMGLYLKGYLPVGHRSALFALAGGSSVELTQTIGDGKFSDNRGGFSYGFGLETELSERLDLTADYMRYSLDSDEFSEASAFNIGLKLYF